MGISIEISLYPLQESYKKIILEFVSRLKLHEQLTVKTNNMSTRIFGDYEVVMPLLSEELKTTFARPETVIVVMKMVGKNLEE
ncbi:MAG: YkoF family thiamine/hydroxymethylpyrimidine-binding protein [Bacteroidota bacterium]